MNLLKKILLFFVIILISFSIYFYFRVIYNTPEVSEIEIPKREQISKNLFRLGNNWLRKNNNGNWECYVEGNPYERGLIIGALQKELLQHQEDVFVAEINKNVGTGFFRQMLLLGVAWFNRDLPDYFPDEMQKEIYGVSKYFSENYDFVGPKYNRIISYHAAHDIGHAVQNMHLVGCTALGKWNYSDSTSNMLMGRNFDFYFGDEFAKEKIVLFVNPTNGGHRFMTVVWGGFCGVVSGMNEKGLAVTLNSDKSEIPTTAATPVSIIAREILQYAQNIEEAVDIAKKYPSFVSESFTVASAADNKIVVIEKTPDSLGVYVPDENQIIVTNHFQSPELKGLEINKEFIKNSETQPRYNRVKELIGNLNPSQPESMLSILRDQKGKAGKDIGKGNPQAINQLLAHHAVIFEPEKKLAWVSNYPFQESAFDAYDLSNIGNYGWTDKFQSPTIDSLSLSPDAFLKSKGFKEFELYKELREKIKSATSDQTTFPQDSLDLFVKCNVEYFETYKILSLYYESLEDFEQAKTMANKALAKTIPYNEEKTFLEQKLKEWAEAKAN